ncbi:MAG: Tetratricopeptide TPR_1 repeat-containing protein [Candidatus Giovannonibacteria bacterium GW2011_GWC2_44_9]|uniref:Tetratricopeptide TPR_1 repeat-containing protein n=2 Tax=Candidatus Giovannoniibacteriota TaxID=1752738 RepID=A0A0G1IG50_9BACT|nr:MAG: Tetratricopeptide TPR_1 repeat-containing protein [Candidatus Giovannonibacteria bacterium GW2011_GWB1_44_23]KKT83544.1 MAG: Tetratricopeptide TPR_1 repeat-containing protein [Candidatus Giovannonibacteria bacterium GW2011_GWC2_44_9]
MSQKTIDIIVKIVKIGLFILPALSLIVAGNFFANMFLPGVGDLFFPFITGKNFFFRIVVEILFALWAIAAIFDKKYRPRTSPIFWAVLAIVGVLTLSTIFGENPYRSFWSNYERMEGLVTHLHLLAYFIILICMFKNETDWRRFFYSSIAVSFIITAYSYLQFMGKLEIHQSSDRLDATLGNSTYLAIFLIFNIFLAAYFLFKPARQLARLAVGQAGGEQRIWIRSILAFVIIMEIPVVFFTATRGAILGLIGGAVLFSILIVWLEGSRRSKILAVSVVGVVLVLFGTFFVLKNTDFINKNYVLKRFTDISLKEQTIKSRFTIWGMALEGFKEHPILGWGPENFNLVFNKYYKPQLWPQEPWFDRAHNVIFDWLIHGGILGLLAYLGVFILSLYTLWKKQQDKLAKAIFTALFAAYFFHNLFVFDNLTSYFMFFAILGFIHFLEIKSLPQMDSSKSASPFQYIAVVIVSVAVIFSLYFVNIKPLLASEALLNALKDMAVSAQNVDVILGDFDKVFEYKTFGNGEAREQFSSYASNAITFDISNDLKIKIIQKAISEMERQIVDNPKDARSYLFLSALYLKGGKIDDALKILDKAQELSPKKQQIFFLMADILISKGDNKKAFEVLKEAYDFAPAYGEAAKNMALVAILNNQSDYAEEVLMKTFGKKIIKDQNLLTAYARAGNFQKVRDIWLLFIEKEPQNAQYRVNLAATFMQLGERQNAIKELQKAIEINPQFKEQGEQFIEEIKAGRNP